MKRFRITIGDKSYDVSVEALDEAAPSRQESHRPTGPSSIERPKTAERSVAPTPAAGAIICPMAGVVKSIQVNEGDHVAQGAVLMLLDAMKVENRITAPSEGTVAKIHVQTGDSVAEGHVLLELS